MEWVEGHMRPGEVTVELAKGVPPCGHCYHH